MRDSNDIQQGNRSEQTDCIMVSSIVFISISLCILSTYGPVMRLLGFDLAVVSIMFNSSHSHVYLHGLYTLNTWVFAQVWSTSS